MLTFGIRLQPYRILSSVRYSNQPLLSFSSTLYRSTTNNNTLVLSGTLHRTMATSSTTSSSSTLSTLPSPLISTADAEQYIGKATFIDGSWYLPAMNRNATEEYSKERIPTAVFFDINAPLLSDTTTSLPHMLPSSEEFSKGAAQLGISQSKPVIIYDGHGLFSAARVWWTLTIFGHPNVAVLDGGLTKWRNEKRPIENISPPSSPVPVTPETWTLNSSLLRTMSQVIRTIADRRVASESTPTLRDTEIIVDARPYARFIGEAPEPRAGLSCGQIPLSRSVPFNTLLDSTNRLLPLDQVKQIFLDAGIDPDRSGTITTSCGSGVTASVLFLALRALGRPLSSLALYDGSFAEYGSYPTNEVIKGKPIDTDAKYL